MFDIPVIYDCKKKKQHYSNFFISFITDRDKINTIVRKNDNAGKGQFFFFLHITAEVRKALVNCMPPGVFSIYLD